MALAVDDLQAGRRTAVEFQRAGVPSKPIKALLEEPGDRRTPRRVTTAAVYVAEGPALEPLALGTAIVAACMKTASRRRVDGAGDIALQDAAFLLQARVRD